MTDDVRNASHGPFLLCAGTDAAAAARLAEAAVAVLADRPAVVLATWDPPPLSGTDAVLDALYDEHAELRAAARHRASDVAHAACDVLDEHGLHVTRTVCPEESSPWQTILDLADDVDASVIVAGTTEDLTSQPGLLGSQARALAHRTRRPLLLLPAGHASGPADAPAIFAYDGSPAADRALELAAPLLRRRHGVVACAWTSVKQIAGVALAAVPDDVARKGAEGLDESARLQARGHGADGQAQLQATGWPCESVAVRAARNIPTAIVDAADERNAAIVVTGTRGRSRVAAAVLGSVAESIVRNAGRPVLLVPPPA
jgi:nucleotide-binding universal stress UspA family protein